MKLGSLFDGSGTCPRAASAVGIVPAWASEIEPFPRAVTESRFPGMVHLGDIKQIDGGKIEPVDVITFGSPCQNLSIAGNGKGLAGQESSLFFEAVRVIHEMRCATNGRSPQIAVWENVYGAFSSSRGDDFRSVLSALWQVCEGNDSVPRLPDRAGRQRWPHAGLILGDHSSIAWRGMDAQYWGVPQRRKRVFLVVDLGGQRAGEILFEREGLRGDHPPGGGEGEASLPAAGAGPAGHDESWPVEHHPQDGRTDLSRDGVVQTLPGRMGTGGNNVPLILVPEPAEPRDERAIGANMRDGLLTGEVTPTMVAAKSDASHIPCALIPYTLKIRAGCEGGGKGALVQEDKSATLSCNNEQTVFVPARAEDGEIVYLARKLTPTECASLQGFPKDWCSLVPHKDSAEYKMWGNGMAYPCVLYIMQGIRKVLAERSLERILGGDLSAPG